MSSPRISLVHPTGHPFSRNAAIALSSANLLHEIITTIAYNPKGSLSKYLNLLPQPIKGQITAELGRRTWIAPDRVSIQTNPWIEVLRIALVRTGLSRRLGFGPQGPVDWVYASIDRHVAQHHLDDIDAIYAYEDSAAATFEAAKAQGILCLYDLPIVFYPTNRAIQTEEAQRFPELAAALQAAQEPSWKIERKNQEVQLADRIFVPSSFVRQSLIDYGITAEKICVIPFGAPIDYFYPQPKTDSSFRALFVGRVGPRKGVHYLLQAWRELGLPKSELLLVGINEFPPNWLDRYSEIFHYTPSVPHSSLNKYYNSANLLIFPSLAEGMALVLLEAMACGLPIIATPNSGACDIMTNGVEGFIIPIRDREALKEKIEWCYRHPQELAQMGQAARQKAEKITWSLYRQRLVEKVQEIMENRPIKNQGKPEKLY